MRKILFLLLFGACFAQAQQVDQTVCHFHEVVSIPREHPLDIERVKVQVSFLTQEGRVNGKVTHYFKVLQERVDSIFFDAPGIEIKEARLGNQSVRFKTDDKGVSIFPAIPLRWDMKDSISFTYSVKPRKGIYFIGWNDPNNKSRKQIWTQGQGVDHRYWIPSYDDANDKVITETITTFDKNYRVLSNGTLKSVKDNGDGTRTWHYSMTKPHALYLLMLGIGNYNVKEFKTKTGVPVNLWYYPDQEDRFETTYRYSKECIEFLEEHTGFPYGWESYSQIPVQDFIYGAMENTTATIFGDFFCVDKREFHDRNYVNVNVHELTHQWFGDLITARSTNNVWLQESYATFYPKIFSRKYYGEDHYQWMRRGEHNGSLAASKTDLYPILSGASGTARVYGKGSAVLDMMMYTFGEEAYRRVILHYLKKNAYKNVETNDLYQSFQDTLGLAPYWFFDQWLYRGGEPHYEVNYNTYAGTTLVNVKQIHARNDLVKLFKMPIVLEVHYTDGTSDSKRVWIENESHSINFPNDRNKKIAYVLFDPGSYVIKTLTFHKKYDELKAQAMNAKNMIDRYDAVLAMRDLAVDTKRPDLINIYNKESFHAIKSEIIHQLVNDAHSDSKNLVRKCLQNPAEVEVHKTLLAQTKTITEEMRPDYERLLADSSYITITNALDKLANTFPQHRERYLDLTKPFHPHDEKVHIKRLEIKATNGESKALEELTELSSQSYEFRTRNQAMEALKRLNHCSPKLIEYLFDASTNPNGRLSSVAMDLLKHLYNQNAYKPVIKEQYAKKNWEKWQADILKPIAG